MQNWKKSCKFALEMCYPVFYVLDKYAIYMPFIIAIIKISEELDIETTSGS